MKKIKNIISKYPILIIASATLLLSGFIWHYFTGIADFLEYSQIGETVIIEDNEDYPTIIMSEAGTSLTQNFINPYPIFNGIQMQVVQVGEKHNISNWIFSILDVETGRVLQKWNKTAYTFKNNEYYFFQFNKPIRGRAGSTYRLNIYSGDTDIENALAFYVTDENNSEHYVNTEGNTFPISAGSASLGNNTLNNNALSMKVIGGKSNNLFWLMITILILILFFVVTFRIYKQKLNRKKVLIDIYLQGILVGAVSFILLLLFIKTSSNFIDENDIFHSGIAQYAGKTLYLDYVCQHPPVTMFLSGVFRLMQAETPDQFHILWYLFISVIFTFLYIRHKSYFGGKRILFLLFFLIIAVFELYGKWFLGDGVAALGLLLIIFEAIRYCEDKKINIIRSIIISIGVYMSFGSIFHMIYPIAALGILVLINDIIDVVMMNKNNLLFLFKRYGTLLIAVFVPFILTIMYFSFNGAIDEMIKQIYRFNREVYPNYTTIPESPIKPIFDTISEFIKFYFDTINSVLKNEFTIQALFNIFVGVGFIITIVQKINKRAYFLATLLLVFTILCGARGTTGFHGIPFGVIMAAVSFLCISDFYHKGREAIRSKHAANAFIFIIMILVGSNYLINIPRIFDKRTPVAENLHYFVHTSEGKQYYADKWGEGDSIYLEYKLGQSVNRAPYMLAWYMDWYMSWCIEDLAKADTVMYKKDSSVWGREYINYNRSFHNKLLESYTEINPNIWMKSLYKTDTLDQEKQSFREITNEIELLQTFHLIDGKANAILINFNTYARENQSTIIVEFGKKENGQLNKIFTRKIKSALIEDNSMHRMEFPRSTDIQAGEYYIKITSEDAEEGNAITVWTVPKKSMGSDSHLFSNNVELESEIVFEIG